MKKLIKALIKNSLFRKLIHSVPFVYDYGDLQKFDALLDTTAESEQACIETLKQFEQPVDFCVEGVTYKFHLLRYIMITLMNPPAVWDSYNKKLFSFDAKGKIHVRYQFGTYFNPVTLCQFALSLFDSYSTTSDPRQKETFLRQIDFLLEEGEETDTELTFPYRYDFFDLVKGPWLSGLAQAQAISVLIRAFILTRDPNYLRLAKKCETAINTKNKLVRVVEGLKWVEEYPTENPSCAINGFTSVIISLFELQRFLPNDRDISLALSEYLITLKNNLPKYDKGPGKIRYSLMDERLVNNNYLGIQCLQMLHLFYYTKDRFFYDIYLKWQGYFDHREFISSYLPINQFNRRLRDLSNQG